MDYNKMTLVNELDGSSKVCPLGFSWTTWFFNMFPALFRGDFKWAVIQCLLLFTTFGISVIIFPFIYNKLYIKDLIYKGYLPKSNDHSHYLLVRGIISQEDLSFIMTKKSA